MSTPVSGDFPTADYPTLRAALDEAVRLVKLTQAPHVVCLTIHEGAVAFFVILEATYAFLRERKMTQYAAPVALVTYSPADAETPISRAEITLYETLKPR